MMAVGDQEYDLMKLRKCRVFVDGGFQEVTFHRFGNRIRLGSDNEPREELVAVVELQDGKVELFPPDKIKFLDKPE